MKTLHTTKQCHTAVTKFRATEHTAGLMWYYHFFLSNS